MIRRKEDEEARCLGGGCFLSVRHDSPADALVVCAFDWFAISLVRYQQLIGLIAFLDGNRIQAEDLTERSRGQDAKTAADKYARAISPEVMKWRDKVAAHYAMTAPRNTKTEKDSLGDLWHSVSSNIVFLNGRYRAGAALVDGSSLPQWSVTEEFEKLAPRYWPEWIGLPEPPPDIFANRRGLGGTRSVKLQG